MCHKFRRKICCKIVGLFVATGRDREGERRLGEVFTVSTELAATWHPNHGSSCERRVPCRCRLPRNRRISFWLPRDRTTVRRTSWWLLRSRGPDWCRRIHKSRNQGGTAPNRRGTRDRCGVRAADIASNFGFPIVIIITTAEIVPVLLSGFGTGDHSTVLIARLWIRGLPSLFIEQWNLVGKAFLASQCSIADLLIYWFCDGLVAAFEVHW